MRHRKYLWAGAVATAVLGGFLDVPPDRMPGVSSAEARDYYTRKRVRGRWITGRFPKDGAVAKAAVERPEPKPSSVPKPPSDLRFESALESMRSPPSQAARPADPTDAAPATAAPVAAATEPLAPPPSDDGMLRLRSALQAHAKSLATGSLPPPPSEEAPARTDSPEPTGVAFDFRTGLRRTTFTDGSVVEEAFDVAAMKARIVAGGKEPREPSTTP